MPASFILYTLRDEYIDFEQIDISSTTYQLFWGKNVFSDPECTNKIGQFFTENNIHSWGESNFTTYSSNLLKFFENSGLPYGDDNILVSNLTTNNKYIPGSGLLDGTYIQQVNTFLSTGEWSGQIGYATITRDSTKIYDKAEVNFPLPVVTYTNAFNSLPQPNTAPLPS